MVRGKRVLSQTQIICEHLVTKSGVRRRGGSNLDPFLTRGWGGVVSKNGAKLRHLVCQIGPNGLPFFNPAGGAGSSRVIAVLCEFVQGCTGELEDGPRGKCSYFEAPCIPCGRGQQSQVLVGIDQDRLVSSLEKMSSLVMSPVKPLDVP